jgi:hypothetical protein
MNNIEKAIEIGFKAINNQEESVEPTHIQIYELKKAMCEMIRLLKLEQEG